MVMSLSTSVCCRITYKTIGLESSVGYDTFIKYHDTLLILLINTKCRSEHTENCENQNYSQNHYLVYKRHLNSNTVPLSSQDHEIFEVERAQSTGNCSVKLGNEISFV